MILEALSVVNCLILLLGFLFLLAVFTRRDEHPNLPPGPRGLPVFGSLLQLANAKNASKLLMKMASKYGPVMTVRLGSKLGVVLTGYDKVREALVEKADYFSDRPYLAVWKELHRDRGILFTSDFKERRRVALTSMRDFGLGKRSLDERMTDEAGILVQELGKYDGQSIDLHKIMPVVTTNIICTIIRGERFSYDSDFMNVMLRCFKTVIDSTEFANGDNYISWAKYIPFMKTLEGPRQDAFSEVASYVTQWIKEHRETFDGDNIRDLIDLFLSEAADNNPHCKEENIQPLIFDLFAAGTETTSTTILWTIAYLITHPDVQTKCRKEIHEMVGKSRIPEYKESPGMPYLNAVINEVQRMGNIAPLAFFHATSGQVELSGYTIPRNTVVITNLESVLKDEKYWGDPYTFRPERWLDEEGRLIKHPAHTPFNIGKRACLGELLAKKELFIFTTAMLQNFRFEKDDKSNPPDLDKGSGQIRTAPEYLVRVTRI